MIAIVKRLRFYGVLYGLAALLVLSGAGCPKSAPPAAKSVRDINEVLRDHDRELMAIPGVVGVYVAQLEDRRKTPCLKVMVVKKTRELARAIPSALEGHPVVVEETGAIRPLRDKK